VSTVWETRYRLFLETLEETAGLLNNKESITSTEYKEQMSRLLMGVIMLLRQHRVNKHGQCLYCGWARWYRRVWWQRPRCTVYRTLDFALRQPMDVVLRLRNSSDLRLGEEKSE
jgi:hypothetical protein